MHRHIGWLTTMIKPNDITIHKLHIMNESTKLYCNSSHQAIGGRLVILKHEFGAVSDNLRCRKRVYEETCINYKFTFKLQTLYREMKKENIIINKSHTKEALESFLLNIQIEKRNFNRNVLYYEM